MPSYPTTRAMQAAARKGLRLRREFKRGGLSTQEAGKQGIGSGVARARDIASGRDLPIETWKRIRGYFQRHRSDKDAAGSPARGFFGDDMNPSAGYVAWLLWGGDTALKTAERIIAQDERAKS